MASRHCKLPANCFCYVCGCYIGPAQVKCAISRDTKYYQAYEKYFGMLIGDQDKSWAPHVICGCCKSTLEGWLRGTKKSMPFAVPRIWREPTNHLNDCYFCMVDVCGYKKAKDKKKLVYPNIPSSIAPVPHDEHMPIPVPPTTDQVNMEISDEDDDYMEEQEDETWQSGEPHFPNQQELDDLVRDLNLPKAGAELLASRLKEWNLLQPTVRISKYRTRHTSYVQYFTADKSLCFCSDVMGLFQAIGITHQPDQWRLFIDSSTKSLKAVLLHNGNQHPSIPVGHSVHLKEDYNNVKTLLQKINYDCYKWDVCGDFKMLGFLLGLQGGFTKYPCFLCLWDSRDTVNHYLQREWSERKDLQPGVYNVKNVALVPVDKILLPPLHIKLGLIKQFVKALDHSGETFKEIRSMFPKLSDAKVTAGVFTGPQVKRMFASEGLENKMTEKEKRAWAAFKHVVSDFLGNNKVENYKELVDELLDSYRELGCRMSPKLHYLHSHLDFFRPNLGAVSEEHGERFHQDIQVMEKRYQGRWDEAMMGDYIWSLVRSDVSTHKRQKRSSVHF